MNKITYIIISLALAIAIGIIFFGQLKNNYDYIGNEYC